MPVMGKSYIRISLPSAWGARMSYWLWCCFVKTALVLLGGSRFPFPTIRAHWENVISKDCKKFVFNLHF